MGGCRVRGGTNLLCVRVRAGAGGTGDRECEEDGSLVLIVFGLRRFFTTCGSSSTESDCSTSHFERFRGVELDVDGDGDMEGVGE